MLFPSIRAVVFGLSCILLLTTMWGSIAYAGGPAFTRANTAADSAEVSASNPAAMTRFQSTIPIIGNKSGIQCSHLCFLDNFR